MADQPKGSRRQGAYTANRIDPQSLAPDGLAAAHGSAEHISPSSAIARMMSAQANALFTLDVDIPLYDQGTGERVYDEEGNPLSVPGTIQYRRLGLVAKMRLRSMARQVVQRENGEPDWVFREDIYFKMALKEAIVSAPVQFTDLVIDNLDDALGLQLAQIVPAVEDVINEVADSKKGSPTSSRAGPTASPDGMRTSS